MKKIINSFVKKLALMWLLPLPVLAGEIYSYVDANGVRVYTDKSPTNGNIQLFSNFTEQLTINPEVKTYKFVDSNRVTHFTNKPKNSRYQLIYQTGISVPSFLSGIDSNVPKPIKHIPKSTKTLNNVVPKPTKYITKPTKPFKYKTLIQNVANNTGLEPALLRAIIQVESAFNPKAVSPKGAVGLMQLMPATAKRFGVKDRTDATSNVYGGARYLRHLLKLFNNNMKLALASYNAGENAVRRYGNKIPPYRETRIYVDKVMKLYRAYQAKM